MLLSGNLDDRVPKGHPLRAIKRLTDECLTAMNDQFDAVYARLRLVAMVMDGAGAERYLHGTGLATDAHRARPPPTVVLDVEARA